MNAVRKSKVAPAPVDRARRSALAAVHVAKKQLGLDDDTYRAIIGRVAKGKHSSGDLSRPQLGLLLDEMKRLGFKKPPPKRAGRSKLADEEQHRKIRALWLSLWNLGVVRSAAEAAIGAFVKRQTGKDALQWCTPKQLNKVVEALKDWATRDAGVFWAAKKRVDTDDGPALVQIDPREAVVRAQWRRLLALGAIAHPDDVTAESFGYSCRLPAAFHFYAPAEWDRLIEILGRMIREAAAARDTKAGSE